MEARLKKPEKETDLNLTKFSGFIQNLVSLAILCYNNTRRKYESRMERRGMEINTTRRF